MRRQFALFCLAGGLAFLVDAGIVQLLVSGLGVDPLLARLPSFAAAVTTTWLFNRRYTFAPRHDIGPAVELLRYAATQLVGLAANYLVYAWLILNLPLAGAGLPIAVAAGSAAGLAFNFANARKWVFRSRD